jgi:hypothetical protein
MNMLRFPKRRTPWLTASSLFFNTLTKQVGHAPGRAHKQPKGSLAEGCPLHSLT